MVKNNLSSCLGLHISGHSDIDFVDVNVFTDTKLFIDPCLIEISNDRFGAQAKLTIDGFFDKLYANYKISCDSREIDLQVQHLGERNEARFGYGNGANGKGKTSQGMKDILVGLHGFIQKGIRMNHPIDIPLLLPYFAEDRMTDMLINILYKELSDFTLQQCEKYGIATEPLNKIRYYWAIKTNSWKRYIGRCLRVNGRLTLLIPKNIVRKGYYYNTWQYFNSMVATRIQSDKTEYIDGKRLCPTKKDILKEELLLYGSLANTVRIHTEVNPNFLSEYHDNIFSAYSNRAMTDDELDEFVYRY